MPRKVRIDIAGALHHCSNPMLIWRWKKTIGVVSSFFTLKKPSGSCLHSSHYTQIWIGVKALIMWDFLNLSARASPAKRKMTVLSPDHPLGNDIEFQRLFVLSQRFGFISAREVICYVQFYNSDSSISAIFIKCLSNPVFNGVLPWTGTDMRAIFPALVY